jgi:hypothetical protein
MTVNEACVNSAKSKIITAVYAILLSSMNVDFYIYVGTRDGLLFLPVFIYKCALPREPAVRN